MQINLIKLIKDVLPTFNRSNKFVQIIFVLIAEARTSFNEFISQVPDWKYKAKANASVLSIQNTIKRELNVDAVITELDGKPVDFLVSVTGFVDFSAVKNLIDKYKLAGRSYIFETGAVTYFSSFVNHVCELDLIENKISLVTGIDQEFGVQSEFAVNSLVSVVVKQTSQGETIYKTVTIAMGQASEMRVLQFWEQNQIVSITPYGDDIYRYTFDDTIITNQ